MVPRDAARWAYRLLLEREPESKQALSHTMLAGSIGELRRGFLASEEFYRTFGNELITVIQKPQGHAIALLPGGARMFIDLADIELSIRCLLGIYETEETNLFRKLAIDAKGVVDIGANVGWYSLQSAWAMRDSGRVVHAFEPRQAIFDLLERSKQENRLTNILCHKVALSDHNGEGWLHWDDNDMSNQGEATLCAGASPRTSGEPVTVVRLDDFLPDLSDIDLIKMDAEGSEANVIKGSVHFLQRNRPKIMSELHRSKLPDISGISATDYIKMIDDLGYSSFRIHNGLIPFSCDDVDIVCPEEITNVLFAPKDDLTSLGALHLA